MKKYFLLSAVLFFSVHLSSAQMDNSTSLSDRLYIGGNFGLSFGSQSTMVNISPLVGYKFTEKFSAGPGITYIYYKVSYPQYNYTYSTNIYGGSLFARYSVYDNIFLHGEYESLNMEVYRYVLDKLTRVWVPALFVGGGYSQQMGEHSSFNILLLYDVIQDPYSPYQNPVIRIGFGFGI